MTIHVGDQWDTGEKMAKASLSTLWQVGLVDSLHTLTSRPSEFFSFGTIFVRRGRVTENNFRLVMCSLNYLLCSINSTLPSERMNALFCVPGEGLSNSKNNRARNTTSWHIIHSWAYINGLAFFPIAVNCFTQPNRESSTRDFAFT